ncbi:MAG: hypothetical protein HY017_21220 [Betaproteobacteria bacterium]|nr:hypothetical protein [Betaproteobacteria bacterium]
MAHAPDFSVYQRRTGIAVLVPLICVGSATTGAARRDVMIQFLGEAVVLCAAGAAVGVVAVELTSLRSGISARLTAGAFLLAAGNLGPECAVSHSNGFSPLVPALLARIEHAVAMHDPALAARVVSAQHYGIRFTTA